MPFPTDERSRGLGVHRPVTELLEPADFNPPETFAWGRSVRRPPPPALLSAVSCAARYKNHGKNSPVNSPEGRALQARFV